MKTKQIIILSALVILIPFSVVSASQIPDFVDPSKDPQYYIDRYNNEPNYKEWFDKNYPNYTIYEAVGLPEPVPEVDPCWADFAERSNAIMRSYYEAGNPDGGMYASQKLYRQFVEKCGDPTDVSDSTTLMKNEVTDDVASSKCGPGTVLKSGKCVPASSSKSVSSGGCLIATATFGTELAPQVQLLREIRDNTLLQTNSGISFMTGFNQFYYSFSPTIADWERQNPAFKELVKATITPMLSTLSILNYVDIDSEQEVLGYGISVILLNLGIYFVVPAIVILKIRSKFR